MHSNKIFKASNEIFCKFGASVVALPSGAAVRREAGCFNEPTGSLLQSVCFLFSRARTLHRGLMDRDPV